MKSKCDRISIRHQEKADIFKEAKRYGIDVSNYVRQCLEIGRTRIKLMEKRAIENLPSPVGKNDLSNILTRIRKGVP